MEVVAHKFALHDFVAGDPALDFVNTVNARDAPTSLDWLDSYARLLEWAELAGVAPAADLKRLRDLSKAAPRLAAAALTRARRFREALHDVCTALIAGDKAPAAGLDRLEAFWKEALGRAALSHRNALVEPTLNVERSGLHFIVDQLALTGIDLLRDFPAARARVCLGEKCGWLFIDTSKGGRRVWCDMATCGNFAKGRRHRDRLRSSQ